MRCSEVQQKLDLFATQEVESSMRERIEDHLESCAECREALVKLRRFADLVSASPTPPVPDGFAARVVAQAKQRQAIVTRSGRAPRVSSPSGWKRFESSAGTAAALVAGLVIGVFMGHQTWQPGGRQPSAATSQPADSLTDSSFEYLIEPGGHSLAQAYLGLTSGGEGE
jgi:anti-sigma factor RsiW